MLIRDITPNPLKGAFKGVGLNNFTVAKSPLGDLGVEIQISRKNNVFFIFS